MRELPVEKWTMTVTVTDADGTRTVTLTGMEIIYARSAMAEAWNASNRMVEGSWDGCSLSKAASSLREYRDHYPALCKALAMEEEPPSPTENTGGGRK